MRATLTVDDGVVELDYKLGKQVVVFSHGFGVRRDARGMFTDIAAALPKGWGYVLFDYDTFDAVANTLQAIGFRSRVARLQAVLRWAGGQKGVEQLHVVGHSIGALTIADLAPENIGAMVLLAPPLSLGLRFAENFTKRPGAVHEGHTWKIPRTDGTTTLIDDEPLAELVSIDAEAELAKLGFFRPYTMILADADEILQDEDYTDLIVMPTVSMFGVESASHDFAGQARRELIQTVLTELAKGRAVKNTDSVENAA